MLAHIRKTHFAPGDRERAMRDAHVVAAYLRTTFGARVWGIGSAFDSARRFQFHSDIDLVVQGLPADRFFHASACAARMTEFPLDVIPLEDANSLMRQRVREEGVEL